MCCLELERHYPLNFSDAFGAGFAGDEWAGNPMRKVLIDKTLTINDVWNQSGFWREMNAHYNLHM